MSGRRNEDPSIMKPGAGLAAGETLGDGTSAAAKPLSKAKSSKIHNSEASKV